MDPSERMMEQEAMSIEQNSKKKEESLEKEELEQIREAALRILDYADNPVETLIRKLEKKGYPREKIEIVVRQMTDAKLLDDVRYAETYVRVKTEAGKGPAWIRGKLMEKGLERHLVDRALRDVSERSSERHLCLTRALELCGLKYEFEFGPHGELFPAEGSSYEYEKAKVFDPDVKNGENRVKTYREREKAKAKLVRKLMTAGFSTDAALYAVQKIEVL